MKTYKTFGIVAAVWAALACSVTLTTSAADGEGDIWYIGRADGGTYGLSTPLSMDADNNSALPGQPKVLTATSTPAASPGRSTGISSITARTTRTPLRR